MSVEIGKIYILRGQGAMKVISEPSPGLFRLIQMTGGTHTAREADILREANSADLRLYQEQLAREPLLGGRSELLQQWIEEMENAV